MPMPPSKLTFLNGRRCPSPSLGGAWSRPNDRARGQLPRGVARARGPARIEGMGARAWLALVLHHASHRAAGLGCDLLLLVPQLEAVLAQLWDYNVS